MCGDRRVSEIQRVAAELAATLKGKNQDYAPTTEFSNFEEAARFAGLLPLDVIMVQIGIKYTRLQGLSTDGTPEYESFRDTLVDLAGYAVIGAAYMDALKSAEKDGQPYTPSGNLPHWYVDAGDDE